MGIGPPNAEAHIWSEDTKDRTPLLYPTLLHQLIIDSQVQHNTMILRFPPNNETQGKLTLGEVAPEITFTVPMQDCALIDCKDNWNLRLNSIHLNGDVPMDISMLTHIALTLQPGVTIALPSNIAAKIYNYIGVVSPEAGLGQGEIDCSARQALPDITLILEGHNWVLGWDDYTHRWVDPDDGGREQCFVTIASVFDDETPYLGVELLKKYDVVFEMDKNVVGCKLRVWRRLCTMC